MQRAFIGLIVLVAAGSLIWYVAIRESPEQVTARRSLEHIDALEQTWEAFGQRLWTSAGGGKVDPADFGRVIAKLSEMPLDGAAPEVANLRDMYVEIATNLPGHLAKMAEPRPVEETRYISPENEAWARRVQDAAIRIQVEKRKVDEEAARLREYFTSQL